MDWHKLQHTLFALDPTDPREDFAKIKQAAQGNQFSQIDAPIDYLQESATVPQGSLTMDRNYSVDDFAALAGVVVEKRQRPADQVRGNEPMPTAEPGRKKHPFQDRLVGDSINNDVQEGSLDGQTIGALLAKVQELEARIARLETEKVQSAKRESVVNNNTSNLKSRQKTEETIKGELYQRLNKLLSE